MKNDRSLTKTVEEFTRGKKDFFIQGSKETYKVEKFLGVGSFGKVVKGKSLGTKEDVAIKIISKNYKHAGVMELEAMRKIQKIDADKNNLVKCIDSFYYKRHACVVFELLDRNLHRFMTHRDFSPLSIPEIKEVSTQLLVGLRALKSIGLAHTDIKPDNIMLVDHKSQPLRVKLIDFGLATDSNKLTTGVTIQTISYRAPEVRLGLPLDEKVDMWGLGHILAKLLTGRSLFPRDSDYNVIRTMVNLHGMPEDALLDQGVYTTKFFTRVRRNCVIIPGPKPEG
uniref:Protein kinase domain-containing protein n=1 Tax=Oryzias melastigma TaxID=30732 RepID=A0A3B3CK74_ORYME